MRRCSRIITTPLLLRCQVYRSPCFSNKVLIKNYSTNKETKNNLWTFLWGSGNPTTTTVKSQPVGPINILDYKVRASDASPFEYVFINTQEKLEATAKFLQQQKILAIDCEGVGLSREGRLCLLQVGTDNMVFLIDVTVLGSNSFSSGKFIFLFV